MRFVLLLLALAFCAPTFGQKCFYSIYPSNGKIVMDITTEVENIDWIVENSDQDISSTFQFFNYINDNSQLLINDQVVAFTLETSVGNKSRKKILLSTDHEFHIDDQLTFTTSAFVNDIENWENIVTMKLGQVQKEVLTLDNQVISSNGSTK